MKDRPPQGEMDDADEVAPFEAVVHWGNRTRSDRSPDTSQVWFQADAMLVGCSQLNLGVGGKRWPPPAGRDAGFFELRLVYGVGQGMLRPRHLLPVFEAS